MSFKIAQTIRILLWITPDGLAEARPPLRGVTALVLDIPDDEPASDLTPIKPLLASLGFHGDLYLAVPSHRADEAALTVLAACIFPLTGFALRTCAGVADIEALDALLRVVEAQAGRDDRSLRLLVEVGSCPQFFLEAQHLSSLSDRLDGLVFNGSTLSLTLHGQTESLKGSAHAVARGVTVLAAAAAGIEAYLMLEPGSTDDMRQALADGFGGLGVSSPAQLISFFEATD